MTRLLRFLTAGESHGPALVGILEGLPAGVPVLAREINRELARRQVGYGRGGRMKIEQDQVEIVSGVRFGVSLGSPVALVVRNRDWENWRDIMRIEAPDRSFDPRTDYPGTGDPEKGYPETGYPETDCPATDSPETDNPDPDHSETDLSEAGDPGANYPKADGSRMRPLTRPRPGHADLAGGMKYGHRDLRNVLERASARETAMRVALGALCKGLLKEFGVSVYSHVLRIGDAAVSREKLAGLDPASLAVRAEASPVRCADAEVSDTMVRAIDEARRQGDSLGGVFELIVTGLPPGVGAHTHWDRRLDGRLAAALMSIQAIKGVEMGDGFDLGERRGSEAHDEIFYEEGLGFYRATNRAGGLEGGITNGENLILRAVMKPIPTLTRPLRSVDTVTKEPFEAARERSDVCAVPAASVVAEAAAAFVIAGAWLEKFGGDSLADIKAAWSGYLERLREY